MNMFTLSPDINVAVSDQFIKYRTLYFKGLVRGQLVDRNGSAEAIVSGLNNSLAAGTSRVSDFL